MFQLSCAVDDTNSWVSCVASHIHVQCDTCEYPAYAYCTNTVQIGAVYIDESVIHVIGNTSFMNNSAINDAGEIWHSA